MFKTILVHLRGTSGDAPSLAAAVNVGRVFASHLECLHIRPNLAQLVYRTVMNMGSEATITTEMLDALRQQSSETAQRAFDAFTASCEKNDIPRAEFAPVSDRLNAAFRERTGGEVEELIAQSRCHDLIVVKGGYEGAGGLSANELSRLVTSAGRPILLAPTVLAGPIRTVAIAWKDTPEAARAVTAALPILRKAQDIIVLTANEEDEPTANCESVVRHLSWYGVTATAHHIVPGKREVHDAVLETARAANVDLLVAGAYGHHRLTEFVFGGFTRGLFDDASIPVFLLH
jgi:nucleotide-binding universal stress UspA family protein